MRRLVVVLAALAAGVGVAAALVPAPAASTAGGAVSRQALDDDLAAIAASPLYTCFLAEERRLAGTRAVAVRGAGSASGVYTTAFADDWLGSMLTDVVTEHLVAARGLPVTGRDVSLARQVLARRITDVLRQYASAAGTGTPGCGGSGAAVLSSMPGWFVAQVSRAEADQAVLDAHAAGWGLDPASVAAYYAAHRAVFARTCVSVIVTRTRHAARAARAAIAAGTSFAAEAQSASITTGTGARGGAAGCGPLAGTFLAAPLAHLAVHAVGAPFPAQGVWWVATVTARHPERLAAVEASVVTAVIQAGEARAGAAIDTALRRRVIVVDPRYGRVAPRRLTLLAPPATPPVGAVLAPSVDGARAAGQG